MLDRTSKLSVPVSKVSLFISYRRSDSSDVVGRIYDRLLEEYDSQLIFRDVDTIPLGLDFRSSIETHVSQCQVLLAVIGSTWLSVTNRDGTRRIDCPDDWVRIELESGLRRNIPIIPLLVRGASMPSCEQLPESLSGLSYCNGLPIRSDPDFHRDVDRLLSGIRDHLTVVEPSRDTTIQGNQPLKLRRSQLLRAEFLTQSLEDCETAYRAISEQLRLELDPERKLILQRRQRKKSTEMDSIEQELFELGAIDE